MKGIRPGSTQPQPVARPREAAPDPEAPGGVSLLQAFRLLEDARGADLVRDQFERLTAALDEGRPLLLPGQHDLLDARVYLEHTHLAKEWDGVRPPYLPPLLSRELVSAALTRSLLGAADDEGTLHRDWMVEQLGDRAGELHDELARRLCSGEVSAPFSQLDFSAFEGRANAARLFAPLGDLSFRQRMPTLFGLAERAGPDAFAGFDLRSIQHLFPSTLGLFQATADAGMQSQMPFGKPYSTHSVMGPMLSQLGLGQLLAGSRRGYDVGEAWKELGSEPLSSGRSIDLPPPGDSNAALTYMAALMLSEYFEGMDPAALEERSILLLDEGGHLVTALHRYFPEFEHLCACVEQTEFGARKVAQLEGLRCPVINVAQCWAKKLFESPAIGESVAFHIDGYLGELRPGFTLEPKEAAVIGYGAVGQATAEALRRRGYTVHVYDTDEERMKAAEEAGFETGARDDVLSHGQLLVSCTGTRAVLPEDLEKVPPGAVVVNAGSGNDELHLPPDYLQEAQARDGHTFVDEDGRVWGELQGERVQLGRTSNATYQHRVLETPGGKQLLALRSGYVVNMEIGMPPEFAQHILALLFAGLLQARDETQGGLVDLKDDVQQALVDETERYLATLGLSLQNPDFRPLAPWLV